MARDRDYRRRGRPGTSNRAALRCLAAASRRLGPPRKPTPASSSATPTGRRSPTSYFEGEPGGWWPLHCCYSLTINLSLYDVCDVRAGSAPAEGDYPNEETHLARHDCFRTRRRDGSPAVGCRVRYLALRLPGPSRRSRLSPAVTRPAASPPTSRNCQSYFIGYQINARTGEVRGGSLLFRAIGCLVRYP
jgi:hypothetical protein